MAALGGLEALLGGLEVGVKKTLTEVLRALVPNLRFGPVAHQDKTENFRGYYVSSTTASSTGEFSIAHGLGRAPYLAIPVVPLDAVGEGIVPFEVTRAADAQRLYVKSSVTDRIFNLYLE